MINIGNASETDEIFFASFCRPVLAETMLQVFLFITTGALDLHSIPDLDEKLLLVVCEAVATSTFSDSSSL
jgi:hypothetical protein